MTAQNISVFFNRPNMPLPLEPILDDVRWAAHRIVLASAWFTSIQIAEAFIKSSAQHKAVFLNDADIHRGKRQAVYLLRTYFEQEYDFVCPDAARIGWEGFHVLGDVAWETGIMHHKFLVVDDRCVWCGSFNFTYQAQKNYETLLRITDVAVCNRFWDEVTILSHDRSRTRERMLQEDI